MKPSERISGILRKCGGDAKVADALGVCPATIYGWKYKSGEIPRKYWEALYILSAVQVSLEELAGWGIWGQDN